MKKIGIVITVFLFCQFAIMSGCLADNESASILKVSDELSYWIELIDEYRNLGEIDNLSKSVLDAVIEDFQVFEAVIIRQLSSENGNLEYDDSSWMDMNRENTTLVIDRSKISISESVDCSILLKSSKNYISVQYSEFSDDQRVFQEVMEVAVNKQNAVVAYFYTDIELGIVKKFATLMEDANVPKTISAFLMDYDLGAKFDLERWANGEQQWENWENSLLY